VNRLGGSCRVEEERNRETHRAFFMVNREDDHERHRGVPKSNAQVAASRGHSGEAMGAVNTLSNTNTGIILAPDSSRRSGDKK
jgi:hypothetical protein